MLGKWVKNYFRLALLRFIWRLIMRRQAKKKPLKEMDVKTYMKKRREGQSKPKNTDQINKSKAHH